jgi:ABC-type arginine/histidine transport system permease subunit
VTTPPSKGLVVELYLIYFGLAQSFVDRDETFLKEKMQKLEEVWNNVLCYRENREKYNVEVLNSIGISTERLYTKKIVEPKIKGWAFIDVDE